MNFNNLLEYTAPGKWRAEFLHYDFHLLEQLRLRGYLGKEMSQFLRQLLCLFCAKETAGRKYGVEHPDHLRALVGQEMQEHVLAENQMISLTDRLQRKKVMALEVNPFPDRVDDAMMSLQADRDEVLREYFRRYALDLLCRIGPLFDDLAECVLFIDVCCVDADIAKGKVSHALRDNNGQRVWFWAHGAAAVPDTDLAETGQVRNDACCNQIENRHVTEEECERQVSSVFRWGIQLW